VSLRWLRGYILQEDIGSLIVLKDYAGFYALILDSTLHIGRNEV